MSYYNNNRYTPGNKANMRTYMQKQLLINNYINYITFVNTQTDENILNGDDITEGNLCTCIKQSKANKLKQGYNDPSTSENMRISQKIKQSNLGGKVTYGHRNHPTQVNYLGGWQGQPGGSFKPIKNSF